jgi:hypothetical protein
MNPGEPDEKDWQTVVAEAGAAPAGIDRRR